MSLLYLKIKADIISISCAIVLFSSNVFANESNSESKFQEYCNTSDAYLLYSYVDVVYTKTFSSFKRQVIVQNKLVVNNRFGVEKYAFLNLSNLVSKNSKTIQIKTHKVNGTTVELNSDLIFEHLFDNKESEQISYPIPGVEPGDTIEIYYEYNEYLQSYELSDFVNLHNQVPSLNSEYTVKTTPDNWVRYKSYNGFPEPQIVSNDTLVYCLFKMEQVNGLSENRYTCVPCELPYLYYSVEKKNSELRTWKEVYNQEFNFVTQPMQLDYEKSSYYKRWKRMVIDEAGDSSKYYQFELLHADIINNTLMGPTLMNEMFKSSGYFLKKKRFDPISIRRLYRQLLEDLEIEYWAVFARSKQAGNIDPYYIRKGEFDHIFFIYKNEVGSFNLLYPHEISYQYQINEIPTSLYNTDAVIVAPYMRTKIKNSDKFINYDLKMAEVDSVIIKMIKLPGLSANHNYLKQIVYCDVDLEEKNTTFKSQLAVSGGLSTELRNFFSLLHQDKEMSDYYDALAEYEGDENAIEIDTITETHFTNKTPFNFKINAQGTLKNSLSFISDSMVSITLENMIQHSQIESEEDSADLNYYLDFSYSDFSMFIIKFPCEIQVLGYEDYQKKYTNDYGEYLFDVNLSNKNQLLFKSNYRIKKDMIPKDDYMQLKQLNELVKETKNLRLLVKLINTEQL